MPPFFFGVYDSMPLYKDFFNSIELQSSVSLFSY